MFAFRPRTDYVVCATAVVVGQIHAVLSSGDRAPSMRRMAVASSSRCRDRPPKSTVVCSIAVMPAYVRVLTRSSTICRVFVSPATPPLSSVKMNEFTPSRCP